MILSNCEHPNVILNKILYDSIQINHFKYYLLNKQTKRHVLRLRFNLYAFHNAVFPNFWLLYHLQERKKNINKLNEHGKRL